MSRYSIQREYNNVVLLDMIRAGSQPEDLKNAVFLKHELGIVDQPAAYRRLVKAGLCEQRGDGTLALTAAGNAFLEAREDQARFFCFASPFIGIAEYRQAKQQAGEGASFEDVMLSLSEKKLEAFLAKKAYVDAQCVQFDMGCLHEMCGRTEEAFVRYAAALFMAARGMEYAGIIEDVRAGKMDRLTAIRVYNGVNIPPKVLDGIRRLRDEYRPETVERALKEAAMPAYISSDDELRQLMFNILHDKYIYMGRQFLLAQNYTRVVNAATSGA